MWYLVIFINYFSVEKPNIQIITNQTFESLEECQNSEVSIQSSHLTYDELCIREEVVSDVIGFDRMSKDMKPDEVIFKMPSLNKLHIKKRQ